MNEETGPYSYISFIFLDGYDDVVSDVARLWHYSGRGSGLHNMFMCTVSRAHGMNSYGDRHTHCHDHTRAGPLQHQLYHIVLYVNL